MKQWINRVFWIWICKRLTFSVVRMPTYQLPEPVRCRFVLTRKWGIQKIPLNCSLQHSANVVVLYTFLMIVVHLYFRWITMSLSPISRQRMPGIPKAVSFMYQLNRAWLMTFLEQIMILRSQKVLISNSGWNRFFTMIPLMRLSKNASKLYNRGRILYG